MADQKIYIGARASRLAQIQAQKAADALRSQLSQHGLNVEIIAFTTQGDRIKNQSLRDLGGKDLFVHDVEKALLAGEIDLAVHSLKDMPAIQPPELVIAACLPRNDPRDALVTKQGHRHLRDLPQGARIGTASPRREAQIKLARGDLELVLLRGNVDTRVKKIIAGELDAALLAVSGLEHLGQTEMASALAPDEILPAAAQGTICIECRRDDERARALCAHVHDEATERIIIAERAFSSSFGASCHVPVAALAEQRAGKIFLRAQLLAPDGAQSFFDQRSAACDDGDDARRLGRAAASQIAAQAGAPFLRQIGVEMKDIKS